MRNLFNLKLVCSGILFAGLAAQASVNPLLPFYGSAGTIVANPAYPIVGENTHITVTVGNSGDQPATNVRVKVSFNDWGVTFQGWQEIGTVTIPSIPPGGTALAEVDNVFQNRTHTCLEAVIVGSDQNDDPNDDRGQINLEVINAGETFSYNVPVVNNGANPINVMVMAHCKGADGTIQFRCKDIAEKAEVPPGGEVLVPIQLDLNAVPPGAVIELIVDAFDLGAADPFAPQNHNHVVLRVVRTTAQQLKQNAIANINAAKGSTTDKSLLNRLENARKHIEASLEGKLWLDANHVKREGGAKVFAQEKAAMEALLQLLETDLPLAAKVQLNDAALQESDADRILAQGVGAGNAFAGVLLQRGDAARKLGDYDKAIEHYKAAWLEATR